MMEKKKPLGWGSLACRAGRPATSAIFALLVAVVLGASGCSASGGDDRQATVTVTAPTEAARDTTETTDTTGATDQTDTTGAATEGEDEQPEGMSTVLAKASSNVPSSGSGLGEPPTAARLEINDLRRTSGNVVTLTFTLINDGTRTIDRQFAFSDQEDYNSFNQIYLTDEAHQRKYLTVADQNGDCLCSRDLGDGSPGIVPGTRGQYFAKFPAPPANVNSITVVFPHFGPIEDVPIAK